MLPCAPAAASRNDWPTPSVAYRGDLPPARPRLQASAGNRNQCNRPTVPGAAAIHPQGASRLGSPFPLTAGFRPLKPGPTQAVADYIADPICPCVPMSRRGRSFGGSTSGPIAQGRSTTAPGNAVGEPLHAPVDCAVSLIAAHPSTHRPLLTERYLLARLSFAKCQHRPLVA